MPSRSCRVGEAGVIRLERSASRSPGLSIVATFFSAISGCIQLPPTERKAAVDGVVGSAGRGSGAVSAS